MSVILLADDSPHAQRMGEHILAGEGYQVVCVADGAAAASCLTEVDLDVVIAGVNLPGTSGLELCRDIKATRPQVRVILTAGLLEALDETAARSAGCDAILRKPFESSVVIETLRPLVLEAQLARKAPTATTTAAALQTGVVRAAVERAVELELPRFLEEITQKVIAALGH